MSIHALSGPEALMNIDIRGKTMKMELVDELVVKEMRKMRRFFNIHLKMNL